MVSRDEYSVHNNLTCKMTHKGGEASILICYNYMDSDGDCYLS